MSLPLNALFNADPKHLAAAAIDQATQRHFPRTELPLLRGILSRCWARRDVTVVSYQG